MTAGEVERRGNGSWPPFENGNTAAVTHSAYSERKVAPLARTLTTRFLRKHGLRRADVDAIGLALLDAHTRAQAKVELLDEWFAEHGIIDADGRPAPALGIYFTALNAATKTLARLDEHLKRREERDPFDALNAHIVELRARDDG